MKNRSFESAGIEIMENVWVPLPGGARMAARLWLPAGARQNPVPALFEYLPYRKRDMTRRRDDVNHQYLSAHGYACIRVDMRGSGDSDGIITDQYLQQELDDGVEAIRWIAAQPWCNGRVGMMGISWGGFNSLQVAARRPEALKAIVTVCASDDMYADNMHYMGGCLLTDNLVEATTMFSFNTCPPDPEISGERWREMWLKRLKGSGLWLDRWLKHQKRDDYWKPGSVCENYSAIRCPVFAVGGWADGFTNAVFRLMANLEVPRLGLVGPWGHHYPHRGKPGPSIGFLQEILRWWDHWLKGRETGIMKEPLIRAWMQESVAPDRQYRYQPGKWVCEEEWPSPNVSAESMVLWRRQLLPEAGAGEIAETKMTVQSPLSVGLFAGKWFSYATGSDMAHDQREEDGGALFFESMPLEEDREVLGEPVLEMDVSSSQPVAMACVRLSDVQPDDKATRVTFGLLNLTHHTGDEQPRRLKPGKRYKIRLKLNHIAQRFQQGHRVRVSISTSYWPLAWPAPEPVRLTFYAPGTRFHLPVRRSSAGEREVEFAPPEGGTPAPVQTLRREEHRWTILRDLRSDRSVQEAVNDKGHYRIPEIGLEVAVKAVARFSYQYDRLDSLKAETETERLFKRKDWEIRTLTKTVLRADAKTFFIDAELDAFESGRRVFSKNWHRKIPRNLV